MRNALTPLLLSFALAACQVSGEITGTGASTGAAGTTGAAGSSGTAGTTGRGGTAAGNGGSTGKGSTGGSSGGKGTSGAAATGGTTGSKSTSGSGGTSGGKGTSTSASGTSGGTSGGKGTSGGNTSSGGTTGCPPPRSGGGTYQGVLERNNDPARDGVYVDPAFTTAAITTGLQLDATFKPVKYLGPVFAQPLYFVNPTLGKDLVIVVTDRNEIYAFDAADGSTVWSRNTLVGSVSTSTLACAGSVSPLGITGTPVIDPATRTMYLDAATPVAGAPHHQIFAIDLDDGTTVAGWPVDVDQMPFVLGDGTTTHFDSKAENQRGALLLLNGWVYVPYGGLDGDCGDYRGYVIAVQTSTPTNVVPWATQAAESGIWAPGGLASDGTSIYAATGNSARGSETGAWAGGEAVIRLTQADTFSGANADYFARQDYVVLDNGDKDLGSTGAILFTLPGANPQPLVFEIGKTTDAILLAQANLGGVNGQLSEPQVVPTGSEVHGSGIAYTTCLGTYVLFNGTPLSCPNGVGVSGNDLVALSVSGNPPSSTIAWCGDQGGNGAPIFTSSDGLNDAVVWGLGGGSVTAFDADTGAVLFTDNSMSGLTHWNPPIVAKGRIFVAGNTQLFAYTFK